MTAATQVERSGSTLPDRLAPLINQPNEKRKKERKKKGEKKKRMDTSSRWKQIDQQNVTKIKTMCTKRCG
jgi:hypothetical protein